MNVADLISLFRNETRDLSAPYLWSDAELVEFCSDAQMEAARRARLLVDSVTTAVCDVTITANDPVVTIDPRVIFIRRAIVNGATQPLGRTTWREMDVAMPSWQNATAVANPQALVTGLDTHTRRLYPPLNVAGTLKLVVVREPLTALSQTTHTPEIAARYHRSLLYWMLFRAYSKNDADAGLPDVDRAKMADASFVAEFGPRTSAVEEQWIEEHYQADLLEGVY